MKPFVGIVAIATPSSATVWKRCAVVAALLPVFVPLGLAAEFKSVTIEGVPHVRQRPDFCGEACAEMYLRKLGSRVNQDDVFNCSGADPVQGRGCRTAELAAALRVIGFKVGPVWYKVREAEADRAMVARWSELHADLLRGVPSMVCMRTGTNAAASEHFRLVLGYDGKADEVLYNDPAVPQGAYLRMKVPDFLALWPLKYMTNEWTVIRLRLEPGEIVKAVAADGYNKADYAQHIRLLRDKVPARGFTIWIQPPFVVIGDESPDIVRQRADNTVKWAVDHLKALYFEKDPPTILDIWLFKDDRSYEEHTRSLFGEEPSTPFGYCSRAHNALIMNIGTGGGTLVHEIVHPFIAANFAACPAWFNEGLGSLYEQSARRDGKICGLTNWRLAGLQDAIKAKKVPSFEELTHTSDFDFYSKDRGSNYGQARYLCYYLQEQGLLVKFYREFRAHCAADPTGYETLKRVLDEEDMAAFQAKWEAFVLQLRFP